MNPREPHGPYMRQWEDMEAFKLANDVVRFVLFETAAWKQWKMGGQRQAIGKQVLIILPMRRGSGRQEGGLTAGLPGGCETRKRPSSGRTGEGEAGAATWTSSISHWH